MPSPSQFQNADTIRINQMELILPLLSGAQWPSDEPNLVPVLQPILLNLSIRHDTRETAVTDDIATTINYSTLADALHKRLTSIASYATLDSVAQAVCQLVVEEYSNVFDGFELDVIQTKGSLLCESLVGTYTSFLVHGQWEISRIRHTINDLVCSTILGIKPQERLLRQEIRATIEITSDKVAHLENLPSGRSAARQVYEAIYHSHYSTLEALASYVAKQMISLVSDGVVPVRVKVYISKIHAIPLAASAEVIIHRAPSDFSRPRDPSCPSDSTPNLSVASVGRRHTAVLAVGSNLGDRFRNIEYALRLLEIPDQILQDGHSGSGDLSLSLQVVNTSFLYETTPMYVTDQPTFINGACVVDTNLSPLTLLRLVKTIESIVGRVPSIRNGPRAVDLDIMFFDTLIFDTRPTAKKEDLDDCEGHLIIPHPRIAEREFVLRPLNDIIPSFIHPETGLSIREIFQQLPGLDENPMRKVIPFPILPLAPGDVVPYPSISPIPRTLTYWSYTSSAPMEFKTHLMATLNTTPDSFSDGSTHNSITTAMEYVRDAVAAGASIVDIGGYSTRPGAEFVSVEEEINRVVPYVKAIRESEAEGSSSFRVQEVLISVDTFRPEVAEAAIAAGANCINDVYAFTGPDSFDRSEEAQQRAMAIMQEMKRISKQFSTPVVLMHSRGDAGQNKDYSMYNYAGHKEAVLEGIRAELGDKVNSIVTGPGAVRRWQVVVDPGIGFSKTVEANLQALRNAGQITADREVGPGDGGKKPTNPLAGFPQLIGTSRKSFLGAILSKREGGRDTTPSERKWATAAAVACSVQQGALVARVHDVKEIRDVISISDALWRS